MERFSLGPPLVPFSRRRSPEAGAVFDCIILMFFCIISSAGAQGLDQMALIVKTRRDQGDLLMLGAMLRLLQEKPSGPSFMLLLLLYQLKGNMDCTSRHRGKHTNIRITQLPAFVCRWYVGWIFIRTLHWHELRLLFLNTHAADDDDDDGKRWG